jgi:RHS repeat-associated protein
MVEANPANVTQRRYIWGLDLSGREQGAGGVGGLLAIQDVAGSNGVNFAAYDLNGNVAALVRATNGAVSATYEYGPFGEALRVTGSVGTNSPIRFSTKYTDSESDMLYYGYRYCNPSTGRWLSRDLLGEEGDENLYGFAHNDPVIYIDLLGLEELTARYVGKSFINGVGALGSLGNRIGGPLPVPLPVSVNGVGLWGITFAPRYADQRLAILASLIGRMPAFNQNPDSDAKDGQYRIYGKMEITAKCCGSILTSYSYVTDKEGGTELPGIDGTINMDTSDSRGLLGFSLTSATVTWKTWGRPNLLVEPGMQWAGLRTSVNISHEGKVKITCSRSKPIFTLISFTGSRYPSRRLWRDGGQPIADYVQGPFSSLWDAQSFWEPTMVR